jgi:hypothetical protein
MATSMKESGKEASDLERGPSPGKMEVSTRDTLSMASGQGRELSRAQKGQFIQETGALIKNMVRGDLFSRMEIGTRVSSIRTRSQAMGR